jgi:hypothetical protein
MRKNAGGCTSGARGVSILPARRVLASVPRVGAMTKEVML